MSALLRMADALDRSHRGFVEGLDAAKRRNGWELEIYGRDGCDLELWYAKHTANYFEKIFNTRLTIRARANAAIHLVKAVA
jgi:hypothetical protein